MNAPNGHHPVRLLVVLAIALLGMVLSGIWLFNSAPDAPRPRRAESGGTALATSAVPSMRVEPGTWGATDPESVLEIESVLQRQINSWNDGDLEGFMSTYWNSPGLTFSSRGRTERGWQPTLERYRRNYPSGNMGKLHFENLEMLQLSDQIMLVLGDWILTDTTHSKRGNFSLVMRRIGNEWLIVHDHSSALEETPGQSGNPSAPAGRPQVVD